MAQCIASVDAIYSRSQASQLPPAVQTAYYGTPMSNIAGILTASVPFTLPDLPLSLPNALPPVFEFTGWLEIDPASGANYRIRVEGTWSPSGDQLLYIEGVTYATTVDWQSAIVPTARIGRGYLLLIGGAAKTHLDTLGATVFAELQISCRYPNHQSLAGFCEFFDNPPYDGSVMNGWLDQLYATAFCRTGPIWQHTPAGGQPVIARGASFAALSPLAEITVRTQDLGTLPNQIPANVGDNAAQRFRCFPSVFFRATSDRVAGLNAAVSDSVSIAAVSQGAPVTIRVNDTPQTSSRWLLIVDGQPIVTDVDHGTAQVYTPLDAWNLVLGPAVNAKQSIQTPKALSGSLSFARLGYLSYARCLSQWGTVYVQNNVFPPS